MSPNPTSFLSHLQTKGYHPRSAAHSNALAEAIVADLVEFCPKIHSKAAAGALCYEVNFNIVSQTLTWNIDLVLGQTPPGTAKPQGVPILKTAPATIEIGIELKAVMTEHRKAVKNRQRDFEAHHAHLHEYSPSAIAGAVLVVNQASQFRSPLRDEITTHRNPADLVEHCIRVFQGVRLATNVGVAGLDAASVVVVDHNNVDFSSTHFVTGAPAPQTGHPLHYDSFIQKICNLYTARFS